MKLSEAARKVIELSRKVREYYEAELPKRHPNYPLVGPDEEGPAPPPEEKKLRQFLLRLPPDSIERLMLIMHLGRGDFDAGDMAGYFQEWQGAFGEPEQAVSLMMANAPLADYLADGLEELRQRNINVENLPLRQAAVSKRQ